MRSTTGERHIVCRAHGGRLNRHGFPRPRYDKATFRTRSTLPTHTKTAKTNQIASVGRASSSKRAEFQATAKRKLYKKGGNKSELIPLRLRDTRHVIWSSEDLHVKDPFFVHVSVEIQIFHGSTQCLFVCSTLLLAIFEPSVLVTLSLVLRQTVRIHIFI